MRTALTILDDAGDRIAYLAAIIDLKDRWYIWLVIGISLTAIAISKHKNLKV